MSVFGDFMTSQAVQKDQEMQSLRAQNTKLKDGIRDLWADLDYIFHRCSLAPFLRERLVEMQRKLEGLKEDRK